MKPVDYETLSNVQSTSTNRTASGSVVDPDTDVILELYYEVANLTATKKYERWSVCVKSMCSERNRDENERKRVCVCVCVSSRCVASVSERNRDENER